MRVANKLSLDSLSDASGAVVLLSGGIDSVTTLAYVAEAGVPVHVMSMDYGQRSVAELNAAREMAAQYGAQTHQVVHMNMGDWGGSALTDSRIAVPQTPVQPGEIPVTYVPARNAIFLSCALSFAESLGLSDIFYGANQVDYSNYPDCRPEFIRAFVQMANLGTRTGLGDCPVKVHAPLLDLTKAEIITLGTELGVDYAKTVSCYDADTQGQACGQCDACRFRAAGFEAAGIIDPTRYR